VSSVRVVASVSLGFAVSLGLAGASARACPDVATADCDPAPPGLPEGVPDMSVLKTPVSPALAAVGGAPVDIQRPTTPTGAAASLGSGILRGLLVPGTTAAVEVTPFWLVDHPFLSADTIERQPWWAFARDFSLSFASATGPDPARPPDAVDDGTAGLVALGARTTLLPGWLSPQAAQCIRVIESFMKADVEGRGKAIDRAIADFEGAHEAPKRQEVERDPVETYQARMDAANKDFKQKAHDYDVARKAVLAQAEASWASTHPTAADVEACGPIIRHRIGVQAATAASVLMSAPGGDFKHFDKVGTLGETVWLTLGWTGTAGTWDYSILGAGRWRHQEALSSAPGATTGLDVGGRGVFAWSRVGVSLQFMRLAPGANGFGSGTAVEGAFAFDYHLKTGYWLTVTAGSTDIGHIDSLSALTALVHLQYNVGPNRLIAADDSPSQASAAAGAHE
jgi:hypothetical protein